MCDEIDVGLFGAKGDGITDDTAAIQKAIDQAAITGKPVYLKTGKYLCNTLYMHPEVYIYSDNTWGFRREACGHTVIIQAADSMICQIDITTANGCTMRGLSLLGSGKGNCTGILSRKTDYGNQEDAYRIEDCCVSNYGGNAVFLDHVWCFSIRHCQFGHCGGDGLRINGWDGFVLDNWFSGNEGAGYYGENPNSSVTMTGNRIEWNKAGGIIASNGSHYNITGNYIDRSGKSAIEMKQMHTVTCTGNILYRSGKYEESDPESAQCIFEECSGLVFTGNSFKHGCDDDSNGRITPKWALRVKALTDCVIAYNTMHKAATEGLIDDKGCHKNSIIENNVGSISNQ